ncbi:MAG: hypothetical protein O2894_07845 [Planctomycetota bacterium]|nr:hypothetical protein [Planctomycetota bacterium]
MTTRALLAALFLMLASTAGWLMHAGAEDDEGTAGITWLSDLDAARDAARASGRPLFAVFT